MPNRSYHFIPSNKPKLFDRLEQIAADAYVFDLEDAVADASKEDALQSLSTWLTSQVPTDSLFVRLNGHLSRIAAQERELLQAVPWLSIVLPKLTTARELEASFEYYGLRGRTVIGLIEDAVALRSVDEILETNLLSAIGLGLEDFLSGSVYTHGQVADFVRHIRTKIALAAFAHGIEAIDTVSLDFSEEGALLKRDALQALSAGMTAKFSIHPNQVATINKCFMPETALIEQALRQRKWLKQTSVNLGYMNIDGEVLSPPKINKLKTILKYNEQFGAE